MDANHTLYNLGHILITALLIVQGLSDLSTQWSQHSKPGGPSQLLGKFLLTSQIRGEVSALTPNSVICVVTKTCPEL